MDAELDQIKISNMLASFSRSKGEICVFLYSGIFPALCLDLNLGGFFFLLAFFF